MARRRTLARALEVGLAELRLTERDAAAVALARHYVAALEVEPWLLEKLGPKLLSALIELGMTPKARNAVTRQEAVTFDDANAKLDELRAFRQKRTAT